MGVARMANKQYRLIFLSIFLSTLFMWFLISLAFLNHIHPSYWWHFIVFISLVGVGYSLKIIKNELEEQNEKRWERLR